MILHQLDKLKGILHLEPQGKIESQDFDAIENEVLGFLKDKGFLKGVMVKTDEFPGWKDIESMFSHLDFVRSNRNKVKRVAIVTDDSVLRTAAPAADLLVGAEVKTFDRKDESAAEEWLKTA